MFGTWMGIAVLIERVPSETLALFVLFGMWMRVPELIERVPIRHLSIFGDVWNVDVECSADGHSSNEILVISGTWM